MHLILSVAMPQNGCYCRQGLTPGFNKMTLINGRVPEYDLSPRPVRLSRNKEPEIIPVNHKNIEND